MSDLIDVVRPVVDREAVKRLAAELALPLPLARVLWSRGIRDPQEGRRFLHGGLEDIPDPRQLAGMMCAVERLRLAIERQERILVYGDYDVDGVCSTALLSMALRQLGARVEYHVPHRFAEGYGVHAKVLQEAAERGISVVVTVDTGISAVAEASLAASLGMDLIVTDHHEPPEALPQAYALINPRQPACSYPDQTFAGVGLAFLLASVLARRWVEEYLDLVALGSIADMAPMVQGTRILTRLGLERINASARVGVSALCEVAGVLQGSVTETDIGFAMGPRMNAAGRMDHAKEAVELLVASDALDARTLAQSLDELNTLRQREGDRVFNEAVRLVEAGMMPGSHPIVAAAHGWHEGVIGIVAAKLVERYKVPALVITLAEGMGKGSARCPDGFDLHEALSENSDLFERFGGHTAAAGFSLSEANIPILRERLRSHWEQLGSPSPLARPVPYDEELLAHEATETLVDELRLLAPYGVGHKPVRWLLRGGRALSSRAVGARGDHLQLRLGWGEHELGAISFRRGSEEPEVREAKRLDVIGELSINAFRGRRSVQLRLDAWSPAALEVVDVRAMRGQRDVLLSASNDTVLAFLPIPLPFNVAAPIHEVAAARELGDLARGVETAGTGIPHPASNLPFAEGTVDLLHVLHAVEDPSGAETLVFVTLPERASALRPLASRFSRASRIIVAGDALDFRRESLAVVYREMQRRASGDVFELIQQVGPLLKEWEGLRSLLVQFAICVFVELGFTRITDGMYHMIQDSPRRDLAESATFAAFARHRRQVLQWAVSSEDTEDAIAREWYVGSVDR